MQAFKSESSKLSAEEKLNLLVEFGARISCELRLDKLLDIIAQQITKMLDVGRCTIYLKDVEKNELWSKIAQGRGLEHTEIRVPLNGNGAVSIVARTGETINLPNAYEDPRFSMDVDMVTDFRTHSMLAVPLKNNSGKVLGVFQVANKSDASPFDKRPKVFAFTSAHADRTSVENCQIVPRRACGATGNHLPPGRYGGIPGPAGHPRPFKKHQHYFLPARIGVGRQVKRCRFIKNASPLHDISQSSPGRQYSVKTRQTDPRRI